jgi:hypothetical protein
MNTKVLGAMVIGAQLLFSALPAAAQQNLITIDADTGEVVVPPVEAEPAMSATNAPTSGTPKTLGEALAALDYKRTPEALFNAMKKQQSGGTLSEADRFQIAVLLGDWTAVSTTLKTLTTNDAETVYSKLLQAVADSSASAANVFQRGNPNNQGEIEGNPNQNRPKAGLLLSTDLYALLDAAPVDLKVAQLPPLTKLVQTAVAEPGRKEFLVRLETGFRGLGGKTLEGRKLAAQLLSSLNWMRDAGPYLPLKREEWDNADTLSLVLTMEYFTQAGIQDHDERQLKRAAEVCAFMMQTSRFGTNDRGIFRQATDRFVKLLPALSPAEAEQLIRENFLTQPVILLDLILALGESGQQAQRSQDLNLRGQSLATQNALLKVLASRRSALPEAANLLVVNWLTEAESTYRAGNVPLINENEMMNQFIYRPPSYYQNRQNMARALDSEVVLTNAPTTALVNRLNNTLAQRVNLTMLKVNLIDPKEPETLEALTAYLKAHPGQEKALCEDYLNAWVRERSVPPEDPNIIRMRSLGYVISRQQTSAGGIPLTRLRQNQNVTSFRDLLAALRQLSPEPINPQSVIQGFMAIHSGAEVYRLEDIEAIFGPPDKMNRQELMQLVTGMRTKLAQQWQDPRVQQASGTNRTEEESKDEVSRGYRTAISLVQRGLDLQKPDWEQLIVRGQLFFDASEFEFARSIKLSEYVNLREEAFASYRKAAEDYAAKIPGMARGQWRLEPYQMWFFVMLGASDLSQLTRAAARSDPGLTQIGDAMRTLPGEAAEDHQEKFGEMLARLLSQVPGNMRQRFLSAGLQVLGKEHPSAKPALESLKNYEELLDEVQLRATIDGSTRVGFGEPFGLILSLEHTRQLARESGGFSKYLQNASDRSQSPFRPPLAANAPSEYRSNFAKNIHAALDETFEISSITFHDPDVRTIDLPRDGWQETPLAYVLLRAKEAAVDRIPSIQIDMDFSDESGQVVLPVRSQVQPIDAKDKAVAARPCADLGLTFTMDEREWSKGSVVVEINARGQGVIASHLTLFDYEQSGFEVEVIDNGLSLTQFISDGKTRHAQADRNWQFTYKRKKDVKGDATLHFPKLRPGVIVAKTEYKHYQDADLVELTTDQAMAGVSLNSPASRSLQVLGLLIALAIGGLAILWLSRRRTQSAIVGDGALQLPGQITPFSVVAFLRRIQRDFDSRLDPQSRTSLKAEIEAIENNFFRNNAAADNASDLEAVARKWLRVAG